MPGVETLAPALARLPAPALREARVRRLGREVVRDGRREDLLVEEDGRLEALELLLARRLRAAKARVVLFAPVLVLALKQEPDDRLEPGRPLRVLESEKERGPGDLLRCTKAAAVSTCARAKL